MKRYPKIWILDDIPPELILATARVIRVTFSLDGLILFVPVQLYIFVHWLEDLVLILRLHITDL